MCECLTFLTLLGGQMAEGILVLGVRTSLSMQSPVSSSLMACL